MISGSLLLDETVLIKKSLKRVWNTFCILLLWSGIYYIWNYIYRERTYDFRLVFEEPVKKHLWFLYAILGMYLVLPFLQNMFKNMQDILMRYFVAMRFFFLTFDYVIALLGLKIAYQIPLVGTSCYLGYFVMGYIVKGTIKKVPIVPKLCYGGAALSLVAVIGFTYLCTTLEGKHSFTIYLCHIIFLDIVKLEFAPRSINAFIGIPLYSIFVFCCSLAFSVLWQAIWKWVQKSIRN